MLWTLLAIVVVLWVLGLVSGIAGNLVHILLLVAGVIFVLQLMSGRRAV